MEQDRTPIVFIHLLELAGGTIAGLRNHRESHCRDHDREGANRNLPTGSPQVSYGAEGHGRRDEASQSLFRQIPWRMELSHQAASNPNVIITLPLFIYGP